MQKEKVMEKELTVLHPDQQTAESDYDIPTPTKLYLLIVPLSMGLWGPFLLKQAQIQNTCIFLNMVIK